VGDPQLLFLDEPTTGLDPASRRQLWEIIRGFREQGRTILLTTHYMDEAERLCDRIAIVDHGKLIALGTPQELIASLGGEHIIEFTVEQNGDIGADLATAIGRLAAVSSVRQEHGSYQLSATELHVALPELVGELTRRQTKLSGLTTRPATLEDVFVKLAGRHLTEEEQKDQR
jgi:ABC-2 type transport system ATP-binding protein